MLLAVDVGNSSVSFGLFNNDCRCSPQLVVSSKLSAAKNRSADEIAVLIKQILDLRLGDSSYNIDCAAVSSVVPSVTVTVTAAAKILCGKSPFIIGPGIKTGFRIGIKDPAQLGSDIVSNVAGALSVVAPPFVIYDSGTAATITVVDANITVIGTSIMPGIRISANALNESSELLENTSFSSDELVLFGKDTNEAIRSGIILGSSMALDGFVRNTRESLIPKGSNIKLGLVATGGFAKTVTDHCRNKFSVDPDLTLRGIAALYYLNMSK